MFTYFTTKACQSLRSKITDIRDEFSLFLAARATHQFILRLRRGALMQTTALAATCAILTPGLGLSPAQADERLDSMGSFIVESDQFYTFNDLVGLGDHRYNEVELSDGGRTMSLNGTGFEIGNHRGSEGRFKVSEGQRLVVAEGKRVNDGSLGWHHALDDLEPVKTMRFNGSSDVFTVTGAPVEKNTILVEFGLRHQVDGFLFYLNYYSEFGDLAQNQGFNIDASFRF